MLLAVDAATVEAMTRSGGVVSLDVNGLPVGAVEVGEMAWQPYARGVLEQYKDGDGMYACPRCRHRYQLKKTLSAHLRLECGRAPRFQCPFCPHRSKRNDRLMQHVSVHHGGQAAPAAPTAPTHALGSN